MEFAGESANLNREIEETAQGNRNSECELVVNSRQQAPPLVECVVRVSRRLETTGGGVALFGSLTALRQTELAARRTIKAKLSRVCPQSS
jgi:hypothetical protein